MPRKNKTADALDKAVATKIHELRLSKGLSRQQLADKIGVTHQQLQKYEKATNRISVGRLGAIAKALNKPINYFLEDLEQPLKVNTMHQRMCIEVSRNFMKIKDPAHRAAVNDLILTLSK